MSNLIDLLGRVLISSVFLLSGYNKAINYSGTINFMEDFGIPGLLIIPAIIIEIILPVLIILGYQTKTAATILSLFCITTAFIFHFDFTDQMQVISFCKNLSLAGGLLFLSIHGPKDWVIKKKKKYVRL